MVWLWALGAAADGRADLDLCGEWALQPIARGAWEAARPEAAPWHAVKVPGVAWREEEKEAFQDGDGVWLRREFSLGAEEAGGGAALVWEQVRWGFVAEINGHALPEVVGHAPGSLEIPAGVLREGPNTLLLKVWSFAGLPRGKGGEPLFPIGSARFSWGNKRSFVDGPVGLDFYRGGRMRAALVDGDPAAGTVTVRLRGHWPKGAVAEAQIFSVAGELLGEGRGAAGQPLVVRCGKLPAWSPDSPALCRAEVVLRDAGGAEMDRKTETFGARKLTWDRWLRVDGRPLPLLGSSLVHEWLALDAEAFRRMITEEARALNVRGLRTHTLPPPSRVAEVADREGVWLMAEMPATFNGRPVEQTAEEERVWRENALRMTREWCERLYNHPSVVAWVPVNEAMQDGPADLQEWIDRELVAAVRREFPGRPVIAALGRTPDADDLHVYAGFWSGHEGAFRSVSEAHAAAADAGVILGNSEFIENWTPERRYRWTGLEEAGPEAALRFASIGGGQTEELRRLGYTLVLPYWLANWLPQRERHQADSMGPMRRALRSALSPVTVALDVTDRNFLPGAALRGRAVVVNDTAEEITREVEFYLQERHPVWAPGALEGKPFARREVSVPAFGRSAVAFETRLPEAERNLTLVARVGKTMSHRPVRTIAAPRAPAVSVLLLGASEEAAAGLRRLGLRVSRSFSPSAPRPEADVIVIWENAALEAFADVWAFPIRHWLRAGGRIVVLRQAAWGDDSYWSALLPADGAGFLTWTTRPDGSSTVWMEAGAEWNPGWERVWGDGWNGYEGLISRDAIEAAWLPDAAPVLQNEAGWIPALPGAVVLPVAELEQSWPADYEDARFFAGGKLRRLEGLRRAVPVILSTRANAPEGGYRAKIRFSSPAMEGRLMVFEHGRAGSSPFRWRLDGGKWQDVPVTRKTSRMRRVGAETNVWFGWTELGAARLEAGEHTLEIAVDEPAPDGAFLLALDDFLLVPNIPARVLARNGRRWPVAVALPSGKGVVVVTQTLFGERLDPASALFDPAAARFFTGLLTGRMSAD